MNICAAHGVGIDDENLLDRVVSHAWPAFIHTLRDQALAMAALLEPAEQENAA